MLEAFAADLDLPDWFGRNWDALLDALRDLDVPRGQTLELVWDHVSELRGHDHDTYETVSTSSSRCRTSATTLRITVIAR